LQNANTKILNHELNGIPVITPQTKQHSIIKYGRRFQIPPITQGRSHPNNTNSEYSQKTTVNGIQYDKATSTNLASEPDTNLNLSNDKDGLSDEETQTAGETTTKIANKCNDNTTEQHNLSSSTYHEKPNDEDPKGAITDTDKGNTDSINTSMMANSNTKIDDASTNLVEKVMPPPYNTTTPATHKAGRMPTLQNDTIFGTNTQLTGKMHYPSFMDDSLKPNADSLIELPSELESLCKLIMLQPEAFTPHLKELGNTNLTLSKTINMKKDSLLSLTLHKKIPRSLRIKCELSTSPDYTSKHNFLRLKEDLQNMVHEFINNGTKIMIEWAECNIHLLLNDRCHSILNKRHSHYWKDSLHTTPRLFTPLPGQHHHLNSAHSSLQNLPIK
jgi:hypothetical protein